MAGLFIPVDSYKILEVNGVKAAEKKDIGFLAGDYVYVRKLSKKEFDDYRANDRGCSYDTVMCRYFGTRQQVIAVYPSKNLLKLGNNFSYRPEWVSKPVALKVEALKTLLHKEKE